MQQEVPITNTVRINVNELRGILAAPPEGGAEETRSSLDLRQQAAYGQQFTELLESVYDAVVISHNHGQVERCNARALEYFQLEAAAIPNLSVTELIAGADHDIIRTVRRLLREDRRVFIEAECRRRDESTFPAEITVSLIHVDGQERLCFFIRNISVRRETEAALERASEGLVRAARLAGMAEIATGVLHDIGNLLNSINVSSDFLAAELRTSSVGNLTRLAQLVHEKGDRLPEFIADDPRGPKFLQALCQCAEVLADEHQALGEECERLREHLRSVVDVIRAQQSYASGVAFNETVSLGSVIDEVLLLQKPSFTRHQIQVETNFGKLPEVVIQKSKLVQVLVNLLQNARDAILQQEGAPRRILIEGGTAGEQVWLRVRDWGIGIAPENIEQVFRHGFTTKPSGHGFGLHTAANFMAEMDGRIAVASPGLGQGATFTLELPLHPPEDPHEPAGSVE